MNDSNNRWILGALGVVLAVFLIMGACLAGAAGGYLIARGQAQQQISELQRQLRQAPGLPDRDSLEEDFRRNFPDLPFEMPEGMEPMNGALIQEVVPGSPADDAGLQPGDLVIAVNGETITPERSLADLIGEQEPGDEVTLTYVPHMNPQQAEEQVAVVLGASPDDPGRAYLGVRFVPLFLELELDQGD